MAEPIPSGLTALARTPSAAERAAVRRELERLLAWQRSLSGWPTLRAGLDATPFVSLYGRGRMFGCFGSIEGRPPERLARAFLRALEDIRFGGLHAEARSALAAQVSYPVRVIRLGADEARDRDGPARLKLGTHGVAVALRDGRSSVVLPLVARDSGLTARGLVNLALQKAGASRDEPGARLWLFETVDIVTGAGRDDLDTNGARAAAARWLAGLVAADGRVTFAIDPRSGARVEVGEAMHHGRVAVAIAALAKGAGFEAKVRRARARLERDVRAGLAGRRVAGWPEAPATIAGTLALACLAGAKLEAELTAFARSQRRALSRDAWHTGQVAFALGSEADPALLEACRRDLARAPWAPWTALAARAVGDGPLLERAASTLAASLGSRGAHAGGARITVVPEIALTAITVEALAGLPSAVARRAVARGRGFLARWQLVGSRLNAALDADAARGAFPISPVVEHLRCDVTGHAELARG